MKTLISIFAVTLALAFTGPAFAGDVTTAKTKADCHKAGGMWDAKTSAVEPKRCKSTVALATLRRGVGSVGAP